MKESLIDIGFAIKNHREKERNSSADVFAVGRAYCTQNGKEQQFWLIPTSYESLKRIYNYDITGTITRSQIIQKGPLTTDGQPISINTKLGELLALNHSGSHEFKVPNRNGKSDIINHITINNRSSYRLRSYSSDVYELSIFLNGEEDPHQFQELSHLIGQAQLLAKQKIEEEIKRAELKRREEEARRKIEEARKAAEEAKQREIAKRAAAEEERKRAEAERKAAEAEAERQRQEAERLLLEQKKREEGIARIDEDLQKKVAQIKETQSWIRKDLSLRQEHFIDVSQNKAKRGHLYDGIPIVIEGGPGTGKTTTLIQRLKFLISKESLVDYVLNAESPQEKTLTQNQIEKICDPNEVDNHWLFFSPTPQLLKYLRDNMRGQYLNANQLNTTLLDDFRKRMLREYKLTNPDSYKPFRNCKKEDNEQVLILKPFKIIDEFERFCVDNLTAILKATAEIKTAEFPWSHLALEIKAYCKRAENIRDIDALMRLFNSLQDNELSKVKNIKIQFDDKLKNVAYTLTQAVLDNEEMKSAISNLFERWRKETINTDTIEADMDEQEEDEDEEDEQAFNSAKLEAKLFTEFKKLIKPLSIKPYTNKLKLSKRVKDFYEIVKPLFEETDLKEVGELYYFNKQFADLCKGVESNIFNQIPRLYKSFRKVQKNAGSDIYNKNLLGKITKENDSRLHIDEQNLLIGFINKMLLSIYRKSRIRYNDMLRKKHKYIIAYEKNVKYVIGVDEATDYSILDYYFIASFRHYEKSSITLCGDIMQSLNANGIKSWDELKNENLLNGLEVQELKISYRQLPTLVDMSKQMFLDDRGEEAPFDSRKKRNESEPKPLILISKDEDEKTEWMALRIVEVYRTYGNEMPSVAIFVGEDVDIKKFIKRINNQDILNNIKVVEGEEAIDGACVRIFRISEVKGMEFEVVFFYNIDEALGEHNEALMRRYLYVGVSRATTHLAATMSDSEGYEDVVKYFDISADSWQI